MNHTTIKQFGSTTLGIIVGVVLGLAVALGVSLYLASSSMPIKDKAANPSAKVNITPKDPNALPDPNESLYAKPKADDVKVDAPLLAIPNNTPNPTTPTTPTAAPVKPKAEDDPIGKIAAVVTPTKPSPVSAPPQTASTAGPASTITMPPASPPNTAGNRYFVQAGAYKSLADAESVKAKLALQGVVMQVSSRDSNSGPVHRVRTLPLSAADADKLQAQLKVNGVDAALVKVQ